MTTVAERRELAAIARRQQRRDNALEAAGLLTYQNPTLTAEQLNQLTQQAIASGALNLSGASTGGGGDGGSYTPPSAPSAPSTTPGTGVPPLPTITPSPAPTDTAGNTLPGAIFPTIDPFRSIAETIMPFFSPEDQRLMSDLYGFERTNEGIPSQIDAGQRNSYLSRDRAEQALGALGNLNPEIQTSGGPGYQFLVNALNILRDFGGEGGQMNRENYLRFDMATRRLMEEAGSGLGQYRDLINMFSFPAFSAGPLVDVRNSNGVPIFGSANRRLFT